MTPTQKTARLAGVLYLFLTIFGLFNLIYVPSTLIVRGDTNATVNNILAHETLFRIDIAVGLGSTIIFMFLVLVLYRLFKEVSQQLAAVMVVLVLVQLPQSFVSELLHLGALELVQGASFLATLDKPLRDTLAMLCLHLDNRGTVLAELFWGLWLFPLGVLVVRSAFMPRALGYWLIVNGVAYVITSFFGLLLPQYNDLVSKITFPALLGEVAFMLWLLVMRVKLPALSSKT